MQVGYCNLTKEISNLSLRTKHQKPLINKKSHFKYYTPSSVKMLIIPFHYLKSTFCALSLIPVYGSDALFIRPRALAV